MAIWKLRWCGSYVEGGAVRESEGCKKCVNKSVKTVQ